MGDRERSDAGTFVETVTPAAIRGVFEDVRGPVITSSDVAEQLDCTTEAARQKLAMLHDQGVVAKRKTGRTVVWWRIGEFGTDDSLDEPPVEDEEDGGDDTAEPTLDEDLVKRVRKEL
jgi:ribosomal protein S25